MRPVSASSPLFPVLTADIPCNTGENPLWHPEEGRIYWTDIPNARLYRMVPGESVETFDVGAAVGGFTLQADGELLLFMARGAVKSWRDGQFTATILESVPGEEDSRFNDVIADPAGRVFCGTMSSSSHAGRLYRLDTDGTVTCLVEGMGTPNGMGFNGDRTVFYQQDSGACKLYRFAYDEDTGDLSDRDVLLDVDPAAGRGRPDGMTVDSEDCIWSARWDGARVVRHSPAGEILMEVPFPVQKVSSITLAGSDLKTAYCTTAGGQSRPDQGEHAGGLFSFPSPVSGRSEFRSRIGLG